MSQPYIDFAFIKENASFERVLEHYNLAMRGTGTQRSISCPFHPDKRPSCRVEFDKKIWHCFACEARGNILEFVARDRGRPRRPAGGGDQARRHLQHRHCSVAREAWRGSAAGGPA